MSRHFAHASLVVDATLFTAIDARHRHATRLVEVSDRLAVLGLVVLDDDSVRREEGIDRQRTTSPVLASIADQPLEAMLPRGGLIEQDFAETDDVRLVAAGTVRGGDGALDRRDRPLTACFPHAVLVTHGIGLRATEHPWITGPVRAIPPQP